MTQPTPIATEVQKFAPSAIIVMYEIDATNLGDTIYRFHDGKNGLIGDVVWQGQTYTAFPLEATGFESSGKGQLPRPKLSVSNVMGTISALVMANDDLAGCKVTRIRTLAKFLDAVNFPAQRNMLRYTESIGSWNNNPSLSVTSDAMLSPTGEMTADTTSQLGAGTRYISSSVAVGTSCTYSLHFKPANPMQPVRIYCDGNFGAGNSFGVASSDVIPATSAWSGTSANVTGTGIVRLPDGWYRAWITFTPAAAGTINCHVYPVSSGVHGWWGAQLDIGPLTEYQPVLGASFQRNPTADPTAEFSRDIYFVDRKSAETRDVVEFELAAAIDLAGVALPRRQVIQNYCPWRYRGAECGYTGTAYFDTNDNTVASLALDVCGKRLSSCRARFGQYSELPYGGFPAAGLLKG